MPHRLRTVVVLALLAAAPAVFAQQPAQPPPGATEGNGGPPARERPIARAFHEMARRLERFGDRLQTLADRLIPSQNGAAAATTDARPAHPSALTYPPLEFEVPDGRTFRTRLSNGLVVYFVEDRELPTLDVEVLIDAGERRTTRAEYGLASLAATMLRRGGTRSYTEEEMDEALDFVAARLSADAGYDMATVSLSVLMKDLDLGLKMLGEVLRAPRFDSDKLRRVKDQRLEGLKDRNDQPAGVLAREFGALVYGADHPLAWNTRKRAIEALTRERLIAWHRARYQPQHVIIAASGDLTAAEFRRRLEALLGNWRNTAPEPTWTPAPLGPLAAPGVYLVEKDTNQGYVSLGHRGVTRDHPDYHALQVMNFILGGGSFTSRLMSKVRSDEGLAYSVYSRVGAGYQEPGMFSANFQTKSATVAYALELVLAEIARIREEPVTPAELESAKASYIERFPAEFGSRFETAGKFAALEYHRQPTDYYATYRAKVAAVTAADVQRVAREHLRPDTFVICVVGKSAEVLKGDGAHAARLAQFGEIRRVALKDPWGDDF